MKILFITYHFEPYQGIGAKRVTYWVKNLISHYNVECDVITATKQNHKNKNIIYLEDKFKSLKSLFIKDEGVTWIKALKIYLKEVNLNKYDIVLITGGPFMHFSINSYIKENSNAKLILDFRDPFHKNPRFKSSPIKDFIKSYYQNKFLKYTDLVITVNKYCEELIKHNNIKLIDNGYDETELEKKLNKVEYNNDFVNLLSIGRIDEEICLNNFFSVLRKKNEYLFNYLGNKKFNKLYKNNINHLGIKNYKEVLEYVKYSDICILFTTGKSFESTTKIFDYLAFNRKILIITDGKIKSGSLYTNTKNNPNVYWTENSYEEIIKVLEHIKNIETKEFDTSIYSRKHGLNKLNSYFEELLTHNFKGV